VPSGSAGHRLACDVADAVDTITAALSDDPEIVARTAAEVVEDRQLVAAHAQTMRLTVLRDPQAGEAGVRVLTCIA